ncbi:MAG: DUF3482 domain-containing protein, partial [Pseudomonadota bacterium]|nr:DUF3482 domain-containing protein [Pseudomonadota bacterium]
LNFIADNPKNRQQWHDHLAKLNLHAIVDFDTVAYSFSNEISLYRGLQTLMPEYRQYLDTLVEALNTHEQQRLVHASEILAELLVDVAAYQIKVGTDENSEQKQITMQESVKFHEQKTVRALLGAFQFHQSNFEHDVLPISNGEWQRDLFDVNYLKEVGLETSSAMAKGAAIGLTIDVFTAGLSMGAASLLGALGGALYARGRDIYEVIRGYETLRIDDNTLALIALRESQLVFALLGRGHASQSDIILHQKSEPVLDLEDIPEPIKTARLHKNWSALNDKLDENDKREATIKTLAESLRERWKQIRSQ